MILEEEVWTVLQAMKVDELIATRTPYDSVLRRVIPRSRAYHHERFEYPLSPQLSMLLDRRDYSQWRIFSGGLHINRKLFAYIDVNPYVFTLIDVGANIGGFSILFSREVDVENFNVHLFEPNALITPALEENITRLEMSNLAVNAFVNTYALGEKEERRCLQVDENHSGISTFGNSKHEFTGTLEIEVARLDNYVREKNLSKIDLIKIDVEACEPAVLNGARETIDVLRPPIYFEYQIAWFDNYDDDYLSDVIEFMRHKGYRFYREDRDGTFELFEVSTKTLRTHNHLNILAIAD
jgi:FkbM family methyltransferase